MIADTTFLIHFHREGITGQRGHARMFFARHRQELVRTSIVSLSEIASGFAASWEAWEYFKRWTVLPVHRGVAEVAADVDREMMAIGQRLGENDNWIAGFCRYYRQPVISLDEAFDRVPRLRRIAY